MNGDIPMVQNKPGEKIAYGAINKVVLACVPTGAKRVLDLGCGTGAFGARLKQDQECEVIGVTYSEAEAVTARDTLDTVLVDDLNDFQPDGLGQFDCIVCSHVLEHLYEPLDLLRRVRGSLAPGGVLVVALPNVLNWKQRVQFLRGRFRYTDGGLMDRTHFRFFDWQTAAQLVEGAGFQITGRQADGFMPLPGLRRVLGRAAVRLDRIAARLLPGFFGYQFVFTARPAGDKR
jgi:SAM-dependent methyltransferase